MNEDGYDIKLLGFAEDAGDPIEGLHQAFGFSRDRAQALLSRLPVVVKRNASKQEVAQYLQAFSTIGARATVLQAGDIVAFATPTVVPSKKEPPRIPIEGTDSDSTPGRQGAPKAGYIHRPRARPPQEDLARASGESSKRPDSEGKEPPIGVLKLPPFQTPPPLQRERTPVPVGTVQPLRVDRQPGPGEPVQPLSDLLKPPSSEVTEPFPAILRPPTPSDGIVTSRSALEWPSAQVGDVNGFKLSIGVQDEVAEARIVEPTHPPAQHEQREERPAEPAAETQAKGLAGARSLTSGRPLVLVQPVQPSAGQRQRRLVVAAAVAAVIVVVVVIMVLSGGMSPELEEALEGYQRTYLPDFQLQSSDSGRLQPHERKSSTVQVRPGQCYGWIATTLRGAYCDLDLKLFRRANLIAADVAFDNYPVVFHCANEATELDVVLENAGSEDCSYGFTSYQRRGSVAWPLETYLDLYSRFMGLQGAGRRWEATSDINHGHMIPEERIRRSVVIPARSCTHFIAVSQQGTDLNLYLRIDGQEVSSDNAQDSFPYVWQCATDRDLFAEIEFVMVRGESDIVWQSYAGDPPER